MLVHRLLEPMEVQLLQLLTDVERLLSTVVVEAVQHQRHIVTDALPHRPTGSDVLLGVRRPGNRWHPGMELEGRIALCPALRGKLPVGLRRIQAALDLIATHRAGIGRHLVTEATEELVDGLAEVPTSEVPECLIHHPDEPVGQHFLRTPLRLLEHLPKLLAVEGVRADQHRLDDLPNGPGGIAPEAVATHTLVGADLHEAFRGVVLRNRVGVPFRIARDLRLVGKGLRCHIHNLHALRAPAPRDQAMRSARASLPGPLSVAER